MFSVNSLTFFSQIKRIAVLEPSTEMIPQPQEDSGNREDL